MAAPRKYPEELRERAIRLALDARKDPVSRPGACTRIDEQIGINPETLRGGVSQAEIDPGARVGTTTAEGARRGVGALVADQGAEDVDSAAGEGDQRLIMGGSRCSLLLVVVAIRALAAQAGQRRQVQGVPQRPGIAARLVGVPDPPS